MGMTPDQFFDSFVEATFTIAARIPAARGARSTPP